MLRSKLMRSGRLRVDSSAEETCGAEEPPRALGIFVVGSSKAETELARARARIMVRGMCVGHVGR